MEKESEATMGGYAGEIDLNGTDVSPSPPVSASASGCASPGVAPPSASATSAQTYVSVEGSTGVNVTSFGMEVVKGWKSYVVALRPWSFTASFTPVTLGTCLAYKTRGTFNVWCFLATCVTALSVHASGNLVNTYFDYMKGIDNKKSDDRTLVDKILTPNDVVKMGTVSYTIGCIGFVVLVWLSPARMEHLALIYFGGLSSSFLYTGGLGLKYIALGDIIIFITFGPATVLFSYMAQGGPLSLTPLLYALPLAMNTEAILHSNNSRDVESDKAAGMVTFALMIGKTGSYIFFVFLLFTPYLMFSVLAVNYSKWFIFPLLTVFFAFRCERMFRGNQMKNLPQKIAMMNLVFGLAYVTSCFMTDVSHLPGLH